jgi:hypothetical protein
MMADNASEWIEWAGGEQPVADHFVVEIRFRNGHEDSDPAIYWFWGRDDRDDASDIIAYRVVSK